MSLISFSLINGTSQRSTKSTVRLWVGIKLIQCERRAVELRCENMGISRYGKLDVVKPPLYSVPVSNIAQT